MADWQRTLPLKDVWPSRDPRIIAAVIAERLSKLAPLAVDHVDEERDEIVDEFQSIAADPNASTEDFDDVLCRLYDWADTPLDDDKWNGKKVCWVQTF
ncbi:MAG: hypothetical protein ACJ8HI_13725 [Massilia sp.]|jgi:hypothetical protein